MGEYRLSNLEPVNTDINTPGVLAETDRNGYLVQIGYTFRRFEFATRYSAFDDNADVVNAGDVAELMTGLTYHGKKDKIRFGGGYVMRLEGGDKVIANDTARLWVQLRN